MQINITDRIQNNKESIRLGLVDLPLNTVLTLTLTTNTKRPVTASYITITSDGETYSSGDKYYSYKQHKDGNYYINLNVGNGYKKVKVNINELLTPKEETNMTEQLELLLMTEVAINDTDTQNQIDKTTVVELLHDNDFTIELVGGKFILVDMEDDLNKTILGSTIEESLHRLNKFTEYFNDLEDGWESNFIYYIPQPEPTPNLKTIYVKRQSKDNEVLLVTDLQFRTLNRLTNLTTGYIVGHTYYDGVIIVGVNSHSYNDTINEVLNRIDNESLLNVEKREKNRMYELLSIPKNELSENYLKELDLLITKYWEYQ